MDQRKCARLETQDGQPVVLLGVKLTGELRGLIFEARVEQRFCNPTDNNVEVVYTFPLPWGAVLLGVEVLLADKHLTGAIVEKKQAEACYEEAISEGNAAIMLEKNRDQSYSLNLGNLASKETCTITLRYAQTLQFEQRGLRLLIPTVIAPRYGDAVQDGGLLPHQGPIYSLLAEHPFDIEFRLYGDLALGRVASPSHPIGVAHGTTESGNVLTVSLARQGSLDRDFVLIVDKLAHDSVAVVARDCVNPDSVAVLASFCPRFQTSGPAMTAVKILVDCSGSMDGDSIDAARRALHDIVRQLSAGDLFSLSRFGSTVEHRSRGLWNATEITKLAAQRWVGALKADLGGTEMEAALSSTFSLAQTASSDVLIVTDGEISAIDSTIESAKKSGHRLFVVGIGSSPAESHLHRLAEATGGACEFVVPGETVEPAVLRMFARLRSPRQAELSLAWPEGVTPHWVSPFPSSVFDGDTINVFALLPQAPEGEVHLLGKRFEESPLEEIGSANFGGSMEDADTLSRITASVRIQSIGTDCLVGVTSEITQLAVDYQLVTDKTNFLLIHERGENEKPVDMPELHKVAQMTPAGWGGVGSIKFSRRQVVSEDQVDYLQAPAVFRKARKVQDTSDQYLDIPAFLRKSSSAIDHDDRRYCSKSECYTGLTPLGVSEWLRITPISVWPKSYSELRQIGLGAGIVDWLELSIAIHSDKPIPEPTVVAAFLYAMSQQDTREALSKSLGFVQGFKITVQQLKYMFTNNASDARPSVDVQLVEKIMLVLDGMTADEWPDRVYALVESEEVVPDTRNATVGF
jgi:Ca-activated chloride channel family protein